MSGKVLYGTHSAQASQFDYTSMSDRGAGDPRVLGHLMS